MPGRPNPRVTARLREVRPYRRLAWHGNVGTDRVFAGDRVFTIEPLAHDRVRFTHVEEVGGLLAPVFETLMGGAVQRSHDGFNSALKRRAEAAAAPSSPDGTLVPLLRADMVPWETLEERHGPLLKLVRVLLGVVPNCDRYLEIWPPAFRTYNIMVPNFLNLPFLIFGAGGAPGDAVGLSMYVSSRTAGCSYCSAHSCSFAMRRGASPETMATALAQMAPRSVAASWPRSRSLARSRGSRAS